MLLDINFDTYNQESILTSEVSRPGFSFHNYTKIYDIWKIFLRSGGHPLFYKKLLIKKYWYENGECKPKIYINLKGVYTCFFLWLHISNFSTSCNPKYLSHWDIFLLILIVNLNHPIQSFQRFQFDSFLLYHRGTEVVTHHVRF